MGNVKHEYCVKHIEYCDIETHINNCASKNWRLIAVDNGNYFFERPYILAGGKKYNLDGSEIKKIC